MNHIDELKRIRTELVKEQETVRNELRNYPIASLMLFESHGSVQKAMVSRTDGAKTRVGIGRDPQMVHKLARKEYINRQIEVLSRDIRLIDETIRNFGQTDYRSMLPLLPKHFGTLPEEMLLTPALRQRKRSYGPFPDESVPIRQASLTISGMSVEEWGILPYRPNTKHADRKTILMPNGLLVRSKSESAIIDLYRDHGLIFHYDEVLDFSSLLWKMSGSFAAQLGTSPVKSPDSILAKADGKLIYHEHAGLADDPVYMSAFQTKLQLYRACGIVLWDNLILTFDEPGGGINLQLVEAQLRAKGLI